MGNISIEDFVKISVYLTGFSKIDLEATGMPDEYYQLIFKDKDTDENLNAFSNQVRSILNDNFGIESRINDQIEKYLIPDAMYRGLTKKIILMWYTGLSPVATTPTINSESAYIHGLIWKAAQTHPAGAMQPGYGSWSEPPIKG